MFTPLELLPLHVGLLISSIFTRTYLDIGEAYACYEHRAPMFIHVVSLVVVVYHLNRDLYMQFRCQWIIGRISNPVHLHHTIN